MNALKNHHLVILRLSQTGYKTHSRREIISSKVAHSEKSSYQIDHIRFVSVESNTKNT